MNIKIEFLDKLFNRVELEINFDKYFSISGQYQNSCGQVLDSITPANIFQAQLISLHSKYHLKSIEEIELDFNSFEQQVKELLLKIEEYEQILQDKSLTEEDLNNENIQFIIEEEFSFIDYDRMCAICLMFNLSLQTLLRVEIEGRTNYITVEGVEYIFGTESEVDELERESVKNIIEDCYLPNIDKDHPILNYIDMEKWLDDWCGNRGDNLNRYDGTEDYIEYKGVWYFAYKQ
jgi:hypothetical protein